MGTTDMLNDIKEMHTKFGIYDAVNQLDPVMLRDFLQFRVACIYEEFVETQGAVNRGDPEEVVDGLVDILVFTLGTLDLFDVDVDRAWKQVMDANLSKQVGVKPGRPNPHRLPDLLKPSGWKAPSHADNHGTIGVLFNAD
jgi:hypothetical protein